MIERNFDIFTGSRAAVNISFDTTQPANFFDPAFGESIKNLASFPRVDLNSSVQTLEEYRDEYEHKLIGEKKLNAAELVLNRVLGDPHQEALIAAVKAKTLIRFRNYFVVSTEQDTSTTGVYQIYEGYVTGYKLSGGQDSPVQITFTIEPEGSMLAEGMAQEGKILRTGDYGLGAGQGMFTGPTDTTAFSGNRFVTYSGANSDNPFSDDTSILHLQPDEERAWQLTAATHGKPLLRIRNMQKAGDETTASRWAKVYTDEDKPTPAELGAVAKTDRIDFGYY